MKSIRNALIMISYTKMLPILINGRRCLEKEAILAPPNCSHEDCKVGKGIVQRDQIFSLQVS